MIIFLSVKVLPRRRLLLELACLPSTVCPRASSFKSLPQHEDFNAHDLHATDLGCAPSEGISLFDTAIVAKGSVKLIRLVSLWYDSTKICHPRPVCLKHEGTPDARASHALALEMRGLGL